jgi:hypothetical protein
LSEKSRHLDLFDTYVKVISLFSLEDIMSLTTLPSGMTAEILEAFWREAAGATYASGKKPDNNEDGSKTYRYEDSEHGLWYEDTWHSVNDCGFGTTRIGHAETGVLWFMQYNGSMHSDVKQVLIAALQSGLEDGRGFCGCRGPGSFRDGGYLYSNGWLPGSSFIWFEGGDQIVKKPSDGNIYYDHHYAGKLLVAQN